MNEIDLPCNVLKKYLPLIILFAAIALLFWVKKHQRGAKRNFPATIEVPVSTDVRVPPVAAPFDRTLTKVVYSRHARCRMECRHIDESEVREIISSGEINYDKIEDNEQGKTYPLEGVTHDSQYVRIVVAPHPQELVVVTVIDLGKTWPCHCN